MYAMQSGKWQEDSRELTLPKHSRHEVISGAESAATASMSKDHYPGSDRELEFSVFVQHNWPTFCRKALPQSTGPRVGLQLAGTPGLKG